MHFSYRLTARTSATPEQLFALISDAPSWPRWTKVVPSARWIEGSGGAGSVRMMGSGRFGMEERVLAEQAPTRHEYGMDATFPARNYHAVVTFTPVAGDAATDVVWAATFAALPGVGHAYRLLLTRGIVKRLLADLVKAAERETLR